MNTKTTQKPITKRCQTCHQFYPAWAEGSLILIERGQPEVNFDSYACLSDFVSLEMKRGKK